MSKSVGYGLAFTDVVSLDAWHDSFAENGGSAHVFCDVGFRRARVGEAVACPVRFRMSLKRAEIHLILPDSTSLEIDPESVARTQIEQPRIRSITSEESSESSDNLVEQKKLSLNTHGKIGVGSGASSNRTNKKRENHQIKETQEYLSLRVTCTRSPEQNYRWEVESNDDGPMFGTPWPPNQARATVIDTTGQSKYGLAPRGICFEARCAREDFFIDEVEIKNRSWLGRFVDGVLPRNKELAAIQYIRDELVKTGVETRAIDDRIGLFAICAAIAGE